MAYGGGTKVWVAAEVLTASDLNSVVTDHNANDNDLDTRLLAEIVLREALETEYDSLYSNVWTTSDGGRVADNTVSKSSMKDDSVGGNELEADSITANNVQAAYKDGLVGTACMRTLGTGALSACEGNDARLSDTRIATDISVSQGKLKTSLAVSTRTGIGAGLHGTYTGSVILAGGEYSFKTQAKATHGDGVEGFFHDGGISGQDISWTNDAAYKTEIYYDVIRSGTATDNYFHLQHRYVTSSGELFWIFFKRDKNTKQVIEVNFTPDHPCMGNGGDPEAIEHPFPGCDFTKYEIVVVNLTSKEIERLTGSSDKEIQDIVLADYEIDEDSNPGWPSIPVTVGLPKYIKDKKDKKILADYRFMKKGDIIEPIKRVIPKPNYIEVKTLKRK